MNPDSVALVVFASNEEANTINTPSEIQSKVVSQRYERRLIRLRSRQTRRTLRGIDPIISKKLTWFLVPGNYMKMVVAITHHKAKVVNFVVVESVS